jgi:hypothetical protein
MWVSLVRSYSSTDPFAVSVVVLIDDDGLSIKVAGKKIKTLIYQILNKNLLNKTVLNYTVNLTFLKKLI